MPYPILITYIQDHSTEEALPHMVELIDRIEKEKEPDPQLVSLLARCYYVLSRYYYNQYVDSRLETHSKQSIAYGDKLHQRFPENIYCAETLSYKIQIFFAEKNGIS